MTRLTFNVSAVIATAMTLAAAPAFADDLLGEWHLVGMNGLPAASGVNVLFEGPKGDEPQASYSGQAPCNRYFGGYTVEGEAISFAGGGATMMACARLDEEAAYFKALQAVSQVSYLEGHLLLKGAGDVVLEYSREASGAICLSCGK